MALCQFQIVQENPFPAIRLHMFRKEVYGQQQDNLLSGISSHFIVILSFLKIYWFF